jgi:hypothetical protein
MKLKSNRHPVSAAAASDPRRGRQKTRRNTDRDFAGVLADYWAVDGNRASLGPTNGIAFRPSYVA